MSMYRTVLAMFTTVVVSGACDGGGREPEGDEGPVGQGEVAAELSTPSFAFSALQFSGAQVARSATLVSTQADSITLEAWIRPDAGGAATQAIAFNGSGSNGYGLYLVNGAPSVVVPGAGTISCSCKANVGVWSHVAVVLSNGLWQFYLNGAQTAFNPTKLVPKRPSGGLSVGATLAGTDGFKGAYRRGPPVEHRVPGELDRQPDERGTARQRARARRLLPARRGRRHELGRCHAVRTLADPRGPVLDQARGPRSRPASRGTPSSCPGTRRSPPTPWRPRRPTTSRSRPGCAGTAAPCLRR